MSDKIKVKTVHLAVGLDLIGSKTSLSAGRSYDIEATQIGIRIFSKSSGRTIVVPYPNVKGFELLAEGAALSDQKPSASLRAEQAMKEARSAIEKASRNVEPQFVAPVLSEEEQREIAQEARVNARRLAKERAAAQLASEK